MATRKPYPSDVSDEEWAFVAHYLALIREEAPQRNHNLREVFNGLRWVVRTGSPWRYMPHDLPPWEAVYQQSRRWLSAALSSKRWSTTCARFCVLRRAGHPSPRRPSSTAARSAPPPRAGREPAT